MAAISSHYLRVALQSAERQGLDPEVILSELGISPAVLDDKGSSLSYQQLCHLWQYLWDALNDEFLGFTATPSKRGSFSMVCRLTYQSDNLERLFRDVHRVYLLLESDLNIELKSTGEGEGEGEVGLLMSLADDQFDIEHFCSEYWLFYWHRLACWLTNTKTKPLRAEFAYPKPVHGDEYQKLFQCPLVFNRPRTALIFSNEFSEQRPVRTRDELYRFLNRLPADILDVPGDETRLESRIRSMVLDRRSNVLQFPPFEALAEMFHMSPKTLQRKLRLEGTSYQKIKESIRRDFVVEHLRNPELSIKEVSYMAGLLGVSSLSRMFRKWTGMSPATYRKEIIQRNY